MKIGEIWRYRGDSSIQWEHYEMPIGSDAFDSLEQDNLVRIIEIYKEGVIAGEDIEIDDLIYFEHLESGATGILCRYDFVKLYEKIYESEKPI